MTTKPQDRSVKSQGFALLIALIVVGVVLSIGLSILNLSISQVRLSTDAKESEAAFHAANAGMECARYWRHEEGDKMGGGDNSFSPECFNITTSVDRNSPAAQRLMMQVMATQPCLVISSPGPLMIAAQAFRLCGVVNGYREWGDNYQYAHFNSRIS
jgi:hypothetical protein